MRAFGAKRHYGRCLTTRPKPGGKIHVQIHVKSHKHGRAWTVDEQNAFCLDA